VFGELWKATEKLNQSMTKLNELQWEYDRALKNGDDVSGTVGEMLTEYTKQAGLHQIAYNESNEDIERIYG
jgi:hypothetical protein